VSTWVRLVAGRSCRVTRLVGDNRLGLTHLAKDAPDSRFVPVCPSTHGPVPTMAGLPLGRRKHGGDVPAVDVDWGGRWPPSQGQVDLARPTRIALCPTGGAHAGSS